MREGSGRPPSAEADIAGTHFRTSLLGKRKKGQSRDWPFLTQLARPAGFEPTTPWFVARYSIQLSYGREETEL